MKTIIPVMIVLMAFGVALGAAGMARKAKIVTTDNETIEGKFQGASDTAVTLSVAGQRVVISWDSVAQLIFPGKELTQNSNSAQGLYSTGTSTTSTSRATTGSGYSTQQADSGRCQATTKKGTQCKRAAKPGSMYCWQHGG